MAFLVFLNQIIKRYQKGSRADYTLARITGKQVGNIVIAKFNIPVKARELVLSETLHKVSGDCCKYTKKIPLISYSKSTNKKPILGIRGTESLQRRSIYKTCLNPNGNFTPLYDFTDEMINAIYIEHDIEIPNIYKHIDRTGCAGCPYGRNTEYELTLLPENQKNAIINIFKESYDVKGIKY